MIGRLGVRKHAPYLYMAGGAFVIAAYYFVPLPGLPFWVPKIGFSTCVSLSAAIAVLVGLRRNRPAYRTPWLLIVLALFIYAAADLTFYTDRYALADLGFPAPADALYLTSYAVFAAGILLIARRRNAGGNRSSLLDALILSSGAMLLSWVFLMKPYLAGDMSSLARATSLAYPAMDLVVLMVALRFFVGGGRRVPAFYLLSGGILFQLFTDATYGWMQLAGVYSTGNFLDATWMCSHLLLGAAVLHPSMSKLAEPAPARTRERRRLIVQFLPLVGAALVGPVTLAASNLVGYELGTAGDLAVAITGAFVFLLVIVRLSDVMRSQARAHAALERQEEELREVVEALRKTEQERARLFDETVKAAEEECVRIAGELHDGPIQQLTALALTLDLTVLRLDRNDVASVKTTLGDARENVAEQMLMLRRLMVELRPPALDEIGLEAALRDYTTDFDLRVDASCEFVGGIGALRLAPAVETTLYRVAQEALANAAKHAKPSCIRVRLTHKAESVLLRVEDDGAGFDQKPPSELIHNGQFGLIGMRERVERAGGEWRLHSRRGQGTAVEAILPVPAVSDAARVALVDARAA
jgi:signal transduction histidine kinase